jgi:hypothetical protein
MSMTFAMPTKMKISIFPQKSHPLWWKGFRVKMSEQEGSDSSGAVNQEMLDAMIEEMPLRQMLMVPGMQVEMLEQLLAALNAPKKV